MESPVEPGMLTDGVMSNPAMRNGHTREGARDDRVLVQAAEDDSCRMLQPIQP